MTSGLRRAIAVAVILALILAGHGRALASTAPPDAAPDIVFGFPAPICHSGGIPADPAPPTTHDCCDACALLAPVLLLSPPALAVPVAAGRSVDPDRAIPRAPVLVRPRGPRLSRGPPSA